MLILYPRLSNGNVLWSCDSCDRTAQVSMVETNAVALYCICNRKVNPQCNNDWYNKGLYWDRIPIDQRIGYKKNIVLRPTDR